MLLSITPQTFKFWYRKNLRIKLFWEGNEIGLLKKKNLSGDFVFTERISSLLKTAWERELLEQKQQIIVLLNILIMQTINQIILLVMNAKLKCREKI